MFIFAIFLIATLIELYVIISVGEIIGAFSTVLLVVLTAAMGSFLLKQQGFQTLKKAQNTITNGGVPAIEILEGIVLLVSGVLLLTPGFITDTIGLLGLLPWTRRAFVQYMLAKNTYKMFDKPKKHQPKADVLDGEFWENK